jgi:hypothetical protein
MLAGELNVRMIRRSWDLHKVASAVITSADIQAAGTKLDQQLSTISQIQHTVARQSAIHGSLWLYLEAILSATIAAAPTSNTLSRVLHRYFHRILT